MLNTYEAILKGNRLAWVDETPPTECGGTVEVLITVLPDGSGILGTSPLRDERRKMALAWLANSN